MKKKAPAAAVKGSVSPMLWKVKHQKFQTTTFSDMASWDLVQVRMAQKLEKQGF